MTVRITLDDATLSPAHNIYTTHDDNDNKNDANDDNMMTK